MKNILILILLSLSLIVISQNSVIVIGESASTGTGDVTTELTIASNAVDDTHVDWGIGTNQVSADDIPDGSTNAIITLTQETNFGTAYTHSQTSTGNPHSIGYTDLDGSPPNSYIYLDIDSALMEKRITDTTGMKADTAFKYFVKRGGGKAEERWGQFVSPTSTSSGGDVTSLRDSVQNLYDSIAYLRGQINAIWAYLGENPPVVDVTAPDFLSGEIGTYNETTVLVLFDTTDVHQDSIPSDEDFLFTADDVEIDITAVSINYDSLFLTLATSPVYGDVCELDYTKSGNDDLQDSTGNKKANEADFPITNNIAEVPTGNLYFDSFNYTADTDIDNLGGWDKILNVIRTAASTGSVFGYTVSAYSLYWKPDSTVENDQYVEINANIAQSTSAMIGCFARANATSGGNGYIYFVTDEYSAFGKFNNGTPSAIAVGAPALTAPNNFTIRMECEGTTIRCYFNGSLDTSLAGGTGIFTDSDHSTGGVGIAGYSNTTFNSALDWEAGDLP